MEVLNTTSPTVVPVAPIELPIKDRAVCERQDGGGKTPVETKHWVLPDGFAVARLEDHSCARLCAGTSARGWDRLLLWGAIGRRYWRKAPDYA